MTRHASGGRRSRGSAENRPCTADVRVDARLGDSEETRDLFRRKTAGDSTQHLTLAIGQPGD